MNIGIQSEYKYRWWGYIDTLQNKIIGLNIRMEGYLFDQLYSDEGIY